MARDNREAVVRKALEASYRRYTQALLRKDFKTIGSIETPNYARQRPKRGLLMREAAHQLLGRIFSYEEVIYTATSFKLQKLKVNSDKVTATGTLTITGHGTDPVGKQHVLVYQDNEEDVWVKTASGWRMRFTRELQNKQITDGKSTS